VVRHVGGHAGGAVTVDGALLHDLKGEKLFNQFLQGQGLGGRRCCHETDLLQLDSQLCSKPPDPCCSLCLNGRVRKLRNNKGFDMPENAIRLLLWHLPKANGLALSAGVNEEDATQSSLTLPH
jgi:hypothetical protein